MTKIIVGYHAIEEYMKDGRVTCRLKLAVKNKRTSQLQELAETRKIPVEWCGVADLDKIPTAQGHKGAILQLTEIAAKGYSDLEDFLFRFESDTGLVLVLDGITDVHNFGAILRSSDLFAVDLVLVPNRRTAKTGDVAAKISSGASAYVPILDAGNLVRSIEKLKEAGFWIYGAEMNGEAAHTVSLKGKVAIVMGSEGTGISRLVREHCDALIRIPTQGHVDSFNVSVAAGILLYETRRQQEFPW